MQNYSTVASRNLIRAAQDMLEHAGTYTVLGDFGSQKEHPQKATDTLVFRRVLPFGASTTGTTIENSSRYVGTPAITPNNFLLAEGTTPTANTISFQDVTVSLQNYGLLFKYSNKVELMYEDDIPAEMVTLTGETLGEVLELVRWGVLRAGSTVVYANGSSRSAVNTVLSLTVLRKVARTMESNRAKLVTSRIGAGPNYNTRAIQPSYLVFHHTDVSSDIRNMTGFTRKEDYAQYQPIHDREIGACEQFRFISSPLLNPYLAAGSGTLNSCLSVGGSNVDVYPVLVVGAAAWGSVALRGQRAITPVSLKPSTVNHANPLGMFGYVGANTWFACVRLNEAWMARAECGVTAL